MQKQFKRVLKDKRGIALPSLFLTIAVFVIFTTLIGRQVVESRQDSKVAEINTNKAQLEQSERAYLLSKGKFATNTGKLLVDFPHLTDQHNFQKVLREKYNMTEEEVNTRIQVVNLTEMKGDSFFNGEVVNPDRYVIDTVTGKVYYIKEKATLDELKELAEQLLKDSDDVINLSVKEGNLIDLTVNGKKMDRVIASVRDGGRIILGGGRTDTADIKLLLVDVAVDQKEGNSAKLTDLTSKVAGGQLKNPITALRLINPGIVLAHYYHDGELKYELIQY